MEERNSIFKKLNNGFISLKMIRNYNEIFKKKKKVNRQYIQTVAV